MSAPPRSAYVAWIAVCVIWGTTYLGIRVALEATPPMLMGGIRWTIAGTILVLASLLRGERMPASALWGSLALQGLMMIGFGNGFVNWAEQHVPSGLADSTPFHVRTPTRVCLPSLCSIVMNLAVRRTTVNVHTQS